MARKPLQRAQPAQNAIGEVPGKGAVAGVRRFRLATGIGQAQALVEDTREQREGCEAGVIHAAVFHAEAASRAGSGRAFR